MRIIVSILFTLISIISFNQVSAREIKGKVQNEEGNPISDAIVTSRSEKDSLNYGVYKTDIQGIFNLNLPDSIFPITALVYKQGFNEKLCRIDRDSVTIILEPISNELEGVTVKAKKSAMKSTPGGLIFNPSELYGIMPDAKELLNNIPLLEVSSNGINIFSMSREATIFINERPLMQPFEVIRETLAKLPPQSIERIEIIFNPGARFPTSVKQGGIVHIVLKDYIVGLLSGINSKLTFENNRLSDNNTLWMSWQKDILTLTGSFNNYDHAAKYSSLSTTQRFDAPSILKEQTRYRSDGHSLGGSLTLEYKPGVHYLSVSGSIGASKSWSEEKTESETMLDNRVTERKESNSVSEKHFGKPAGGIAARYSVPFATWWGVDLSAAHYFQPKNPSTLRSGYIGNLELDNFQQNSSHSNSSSARVSLWRTFRRPLTLYLTLDYSDANLKYDLLENNHQERFDYKEQYFSAALQGAARISLVSLQAGVSLQYTNRKLYDFEDIPDSKHTYLNVVPDISASVMLGDMHNLSLSVSSSVSQPELSDLSPIKRWISSTQYYMGNPDLKPSKDFKYTFRYTLGSFLEYNISYTDFLDLAAETIIPTEDNIFVSTKIPGAKCQLVNTDIYFDKWFFNQWVNLSALASYSWTRMTSSEIGYGKSISNSFSFRVSPQCFLSKRHNMKFTLSYMFTKGSKTLTQKFSNKHYLALILRKNFKFGMDCSLTYKQFINKSTKYYISDFYQYSFSLSNSNQPTISLSISYRFGNTQVKQVGLENRAKNGRLNI